MDQMPGTSPAFDLQPHPPAPRFPVDEPQSLHPPVQILWRVSGLISALLFAGVALPLELMVLARQPWWPVPAPLTSLLLFVLLTILFQVFIKRQFEAWRFVLRPADLLITYGVFWKTRRSIPRLRVQHVDITSGPIERQLGLVQLSLYTAGTMGAVGTIPGLTPEAAESLRQTLLETRPPSA
jgi:uncharacterized protein